MLMHIFFIFFTMCVPSVLGSKLDTSTYIITFRFGQCDNLDANTIKKIEVIMMKKGWLLFKRTIKSMFLTDKNKTLNIEIDDLLDKKKSLDEIYQISFCNAADKKVFEQDFGFERNEDGTLTMYTTRSRKAVDHLMGVYHKYLVRLFREDKSFSTVPKSNVLITKDFIKNYKISLNHYFDRHRGLKETVDCLNDCLSQIKKEADIPLQLKNFIDGRRLNLNGLNEGFSKIEGMHNYCFNVEYELSNLLIDLLMFIEIYTKIGSNLNTRFLLIDQNVYTAIKEVKIFNLPYAITNDDKSEVGFKILPEGDIDSYFGKDVWLDKMKLYVSLDFCKNCQMKSLSLKVFSSKEKEKFITLELYSV